MAIIIAFNTTIKRIVTEIEKFDDIEQRSILAYLKAKRLLAKPRKPIAKSPAAISMSTIDAIKHKARTNAIK